MTPDRPASDSWAGMNPNSGHQRWSRWDFTIAATVAKQPAQDFVLDAARRFFRQMFHTTTGQVRVTVLGLSYLVSLRVEGVAVHDPSVRAAVQAQFAEHFVARGFGAGARLVRMDASLLAGSAEDGTPADHLIVLPTIPIT